MELRQSRYDGFSSNALLPASTRACRESRRAVPAQYECCFNSFHNPARVLFNFDVDTLYLETKTIRPMCWYLRGVLKETELERLRYLAVDEELLDEEGKNAGFAAGLGRAVMAMTRLEELKIVLDIGSVLALSEQMNALRSVRQIVFLDEARSRQRTCELGWNWPDRKNERGRLPDLKRYESWLPKHVKVEGVYGWRSCLLSNEKKEVGSSSSDFTDTDWLGWEAMDPDEGILSDVLFLDQHTFDTQL